MCKATFAASLAVTLLLAASASASIIEDFELPGISPPSFRSGWTADPAWLVGEDNDGILPDIDPAPVVGGANYAYSGLPNNTESNTGSVTSPKLTATLTTLTWLSAGFAGHESLPADGSNYFEILNSSQIPIASSKTNPGQSNNWVSLSIDLSSIGLFFGDEYYFRAVDNNDGQNYAWIAFDNLAITGDELPIRPNVVPEATSFLIWGLIGLTFAVGGWKHRTRN